MLMDKQVQPPVKDLPGQEQTEGASGEEQQLYEDMVAGITEFLFGKGKGDIANQLANAQEMSQTIGEIAFTLVQSAAEQVKGAGQDGLMDMDMLFGVTAETIDSLIRMVEALKIEAAPADQLREQAMIVAVQSYLQTAQPGSEEQAAAQQMLSEMHADGTTEAGAAELQGIGERAGVDPFAGAGGEQMPPEEEMPPADAGPMMGG